LRSPVFMTERIVIYHLAGSKLKQVEEFAVDAYTEITIGREPASTIRFDQADDDGVSAKHCRIRIAGDPPSLLLSDCSGRNDTLVNGREIEIEVEVFPGDEIELGRGGPKFVLDWASAPGSHTPRKVSLPQADAAAANALLPVRTVATVPAVGQVARRSATGSLMIRPSVPAAPSSRRSLAYGSLGIILLLGLAAGAAYQLSDPATPVQQAASAAGTSEPAPVASVAPADKSAVEMPSARHADGAAKTPAVSVPSHSDEAKVAALPSIDPPRTAAMPDRTPDLAGTVRKIAGASRFQVQDQWIELYGVDDPTTKGEHNQGVYEYLKPFAGAIQCYSKAYGRFECFGGGQNLAVIAIRRGFVRLTSDAPSEYYALVRRMAAER
jgi:hypothetical protein